MQNPALTSASRKVRQRLIPFLILCYFVSYLDRVNIGFAALTMNADLGIGPEAFGFIAGIFFSGIACSKCQATSCWPGSGRGFGSRAS